MEKPWAPEEDQERQYGEDEQLTSSLSRNFHNALESQYFIPCLKSLLNKITLPDDVAIDVNVPAQIRKNRDAIIKAIISRYSLNAEKQIAVNLILQALISQHNIQLPAGLYVKPLCEEIRTLTNILIEHKINIENEFKTVIAKYKDSDNNIRMHHELSEEDKKGGTIGKDEEYLRVYKAALGSLALTNQISKADMQVAFGDNVEKPILKRGIENPYDPRKFVIVGNWDPTTKIFTLGYDIRGRHHRCIVSRMIDQGENSVFNVEDSIPPINLARQYKQIQVTTHPDDMTQRAKTIRDSGKPLVLGGGDSFFYYDDETGKYVLGLSGTSLQYGIVENAFLSIPGLVESIKDRYAQELNIEASDIEVIALPQRHGELSYCTIQDVYKSANRTT